MRYLFDQHEKVQLFLGNRDGLHRDENMTDIRKTRWIAPTVNWKILAEGVGVGVP